MGYWDCCVMAEVGEDVAVMGRRLGFEGVVVLSEKPGVTGAAKGAEEGLLIRPKSAGHMRKAVAKSRKKSLVIAVLSADDQMNRAVTESRQVDILIPGKGTRVDVTMAKLARENGVRVAFSLSDIIHSSLQERGRVFTQLRKNAACVSKSKAPFIVTSGAESPFCMRSPSELMSFGRLLGLGEESLRQSMSASFIEENRKRLSEGWVMPGVEVRK